MKSWKWVGLVASGGLMMQAVGCVQLFQDLFLQALLQALAAAITSAATTV
jgi:hypothetical protein